MESTARVHWLIASLLRFMAVRSVGVGWVASEIAAAPCEVEAVLQGRIPPEQLGYYAYGSLVALLTVDGPPVAESSESEDCHLLPEERLERDPLLMLSCALLYYMVDGDDLEYDPELMLQKWRVLVSRLYDPRWSGGGHYGECTGDQKQCCWRCVVEETLTELQALVASPKGGE